MIRALASTQNSLTLLVARVAAGAVLFPHGAQKLLGWFDGPGPQATVDAFSSMGTPVLVSWLVILAESLGAIGLVAGFMGRFCALGNLLVMGGAVAMVHGQHGFFMNWFGQQEGEGFEYHILMMALLTITLIGGSGALSIDIGLTRRRA